MSAAWTPRTRERRLLWGVFVGLWGLYLLTASREPPWSEGELIVEVAEAMVERQSFEIAWHWFPMSHRGPDGALHAPYTLLPSLVQIPGVLLLEALGPRLRLFSLPLAMQLAPSALAALSCVLFLVLSRRAGAGLKTALAATLVLALSTGLWVYARRPYSETLQAACVLGFVLAIARLLDAPGRRAAAVCGIAGGLMLNAEVALGLGFLTGLVVAFTALRGRGQRLGSMMLWVAVGAGPLVVMALGYNAARWGTPFDSGHPAFSLAREHVGWGLAGLLFSPGRSVLLFNPATVLGLVLLPGLWRKNRVLVRIAAFVAVPPMVLHATTQLWTGGWCWGPRVWLFAVPIMLLPIGPWLEGRRDGKAPRRRAAWILVAALGLGGAWVQTMGNAIFWDHHIRLAKQVQRRWLGPANRRGAIVEDRGAGTCDPCIEDLYGMIWVPALQPIAGHAWMVRHMGDDADNAAALVDAPWRRYTTLDIDLGRTLRKTPVDWWGLLWLDDFPERRGTGIVLLILFSGMMLGGVALSWRSLRSRQT